MEEENLKRLKFSGELSVADVLREATDRQIDDKLQVGAKYCNLS